MKFSKRRATVVLALIATYSCHRNASDANAQREGTDARSAAAGPVASKTTTPSESDYFIQEGTLPPMGSREDISLSRPEAPRPCPDYSQRGDDAWRIDPNCAQSGVEILNPIAPTPSETQNPTP